jgi:lipopolysaccharide heptosyltransferase I
LITRLSAIGDCVQTLPVASALRERFPRATIVWAVEAGAAPLVAAHPAIDRVIVVPKRMLASPAAAWQVRQQLMPLRLDIAIDPQGLSKSSAIGWLSGAPRRIGFAGPQGREISGWLNSELVHATSTHMVDRYLELLRPLGIEMHASDQPRFEISIDAAARNKIGRFVSDTQRTDGFAVINPGAGWDSKRWPIGRFAEVARQLGIDYALPSVVAWGGSRERAWAEEIVAGSGGHASLAPATSLIELAALLTHAKVMIAADTGPLHLAAAVGTPSIGLFGSTRREACGPYGKGNIALQAAFDGSPGRKLAGADNWAVRRISVDQVLKACETVIFEQKCRANSLLAAG